MVIWSHDLSFLVLSTIKRFKFADSLTQLSPLIFAAATSELYKRFL